MKLRVKFTRLIATNVDYESFSSPDGGLVPCPLRLDSDLELACPQNFPPTEQLHISIHFNLIFPKQEWGLHI